MRKDKKDLSFIGNYTNTNRAFRLGKISCYTCNFNFY